MKLPASFFGMLLAAGCVFADPITYTAYLNGAIESPPNTSQGTGFTTVIYDPTAHTLSVAVTFSGLSGVTTASHIHCCTTVAQTGTAGIATETPTFGGFPLGVTSGSYLNFYDLTLAASWNPPFVTANTNIAGAEAAFAAGLASGKAYLNVHSKSAPGGEIRGFLAAVPEPGTYLLLGSVIASMAALRRNHPKRS